MLNQSKCYSKGETRNAIMPPIDAPNRRCDYWLWRKAQLSNVQTGRPVPDTSWMFCNLWRAPVWLHVMYIYVRVFDFIKYCMCCRTKNSWLTGELIFRHANSARGGQSCAACDRASGWFAWSMCTGVKPFLGIRVRLTRGLLFWEKRRGGM